MIRSSTQIKGLCIDVPDATHRVTLSLFTDDVAVFLAEDNSPEALFNLLDKWCLTSGAKFNKNKTVIIPVGSPDYRKSISDSQKLNASTNLPFEDSIHILRDGEPTRYLGTQIGNQLSGNEPWPKIIEDIEASLNQWQKAFPSIEGRKHIIQMVIGSKTQFITAMQGMPSKYEDYLNKRIRSFLWNSDTPPPMATQLLSESHQKGGINVLDIKARNEAINIMKLKKLADYSPNHPIASDAALEIVIASTKLPNPPCPKDGPSIRDFLIQSTTKSQKLPQKNLLTDLKSILKTGSKYNLTLDAPCFSLTHKMNLPAWFHIGKDPKAPMREHKKTSKCLWNTHKVRTVYN